MTEIKKLSTSFDYFHLPSEILEIEDVVKRHVSESIVDVISEIFDDEAEAVSGFSLSSDGFIVKPFFEGEYLVPWDDMVIEIDHVEDHGQSIANARAALLEVKTAFTAWYERIEAELDEDEAE